MSHRTKRNWSAKPEEKESLLDPNEANHAEHDEDASGGDEEESILRSPLFRMYCSYALSTWGSRLWKFSMSIMLVSIGGNLRLPAINGIVSGCGVLLLGSLVGKYIDLSGRISVARLSLVMTNGLIVLSASCLAVLLIWPDGQIKPTWQVVLIGLSIFFEAASVLASTAFKICVTKDWVIVICRERRDLLAKSNAVMLRIDLASMIISPTIGGQLMTLWGVKAGCLFIIAWHLVSVGVEYYLLNLVYCSSPELQLPKGNNVNRANLPQMHYGINIPEEQCEVEGNQKTSGPLGNCYKALKLVGKRTLNGWLCYYRQSVFPAAMALATLYLTVLGLDGITTGYAYSQGLKENVLAILRAVGALSGISGSMMFPCLRKRIGLARTGLISFILQLSCLLISVTSIWLPGSAFDPLAYFFPNQQRNNNQTVTEKPFESIRPTVSIWVFVIGVIASRCGLWLTDLAIAQTMQEEIAENQRGTVNGVQNSVQNFMDLAKNALTVALPEPETFGLLVIISWLSTFAAFCFYMVHSKKVRGHILPLHGLYYKLQRDITDNWT